MFSPYIFPLHFIGFDILLADLNVKLTCYRKLRNFHFLSSTFYLWRVQSKAGQWKLNPSDGKLINRIHPCSWRPIGHMRPSSPLLDSVRDQFEGQDQMAKVGWLLVTFTLIYARFFTNISLHALGVIINLHVFTFFYESLALMYKRALFREEWRMYKKKSCQKANFRPNP